jgi:uncharacterized protein YdiU (UPF0061 family)
VASPALTDGLAISAVERNPAFIPRNHLVEEALSAAVNNGDLSAFEKLLAVLSSPYDDQPPHRLYAEPSRPDQIVRQTFCGT